MKHDLYQQAASLFGILSHPGRLRILDELRKEQACVCHLQAVLERPQVYVSQQLRVLREAGVVTDRREGTLVYYRLADSRVEALLEEMLGSPGERTCVAGCPCPGCQAEARPEFARLDQAADGTGACCPENGGGMSNDLLRQAVRQRYSRVGRSGGCCGPAVSSCCSPAPQAAAEGVGYSEAELAAVPEGANLGLGCGNPQAIAALKPGEVVLDLGSGGGLDCFLAARAVGETGRVIGVDMTPEMIDRARAAARKGGFTNVEFRLGEIENLPVADNSVDVIMSNCVINLSPDKPRVFCEAFRVLKPGGRLAVSDIVATAELPAELAADLDLYAGCVSGAAPIDALERMLKEAGFAEVRIAPHDESRAFIRQWALGLRVEDFVAAATIEAVKPRDADEHR